MSLPLGIGALVVIFLCWLFRWGLDEVAWRRDERDAERRLARLIVAYRSQQTLDMWDDAMDQLGISSPLADETRVARLERQFELPAAPDPRWLA